MLVKDVDFKVRAPIDELSDEYLHRQFDTRRSRRDTRNPRVRPGDAHTRRWHDREPLLLVGTIAFPYTGIYAASKHAMEAISEAMWFELAPSGMRLAVVAPGAFHTTGFVAGTACRLIRPQ